MRINKIAASIITLGMAASPFAYATNGMNMEGYGPVSTAMGGASMAYDNGSAAMMNNPATIGLMPNGSRLDVAVGVMGPKVKSEAGGATADSSGDAYYMPALGYLRKDGPMAYGFGVFAQGGMGTEYGSNSFMSAGSGNEVRSEVGVGRALVPLAYDVNEQLAVGGSVDFVWASMDLKMVMPGAQFLDMAGSFGGSQTLGSVGNTMMTAFGGAVGTGFINGANPVNWGYFDFSNGDKFSGKAKGNGFAAKIGFTYKLNSQVTIGGTYHSKTSLSDLEADGAKVSFNANLDDGMLGGGAASGTYTAMTIPVTGKISVKNFQWPETYGMGVAYQANDQLLVVADYKRIGWKAVMKDFKMTFVADGTQANPLAAGFAGTTLDATLYQNWKDQDVIMLGAAYKATQELTLRAGLQTSGNPVPDAYLNALFPAIVKDQYTLGGGYMFNAASSFDMSVTIVPEVSATNPNTGVTSKMSQTNYQLLYSYRF
ncbi:MAG: outer membrane protein transport protein [Sideroxyarcus sp.]|nr:outer membrane protein transport protein [Sideroxyarcus sp.]